MILAGLLVLSPMPGLAVEVLHPASDADLLGCWIKDRSPAQIRADDADGVVDQFTLCFERNWDATTTAIGGSKAYGLEGIDDGGHYAIDHGRLSVRGPSVSDTWFFGSAARCDALTDGQILHLTNCIGYGSGGDEPTVLDTTTYTRVPKS
jgi:hypothetical protein